MRLLILITLIIFPLLASADCQRLAPARGVPAASDQTWALATLNLWRLRDDRKNSELDSPVSSAVLEARVNAVAEFVVAKLNAPHVLALQEVENRAVLDRLADQMAKRGYRYRSVLREGNDPSGMDVAVLYRSPVKIGAVRTLFSDQQFHGHALYSRPPLVVALEAPLAANLVVVHLRSARDLKKTWVHEKRQTQAALLANWVTAQTPPLIVAGDFNTTWDAGRFSDSYERFEQSGLLNLWQSLPEKERYSFRHRCRPQALDHIWVTPGLKTFVSKIAVSRGNAGRYDSLYGSKGVAPVSDHDALVVYFER
ncbi:endonuclease/exonuclease/phosphatase family protein [Alcanivorax sp.]|jgi:endonuclease/exonuclease/phosphatase family metal-dependent hydrolase|uniref:endonuclease/exonuclease/phosphatase family protein n=1 Tax=Alcanivorax sp. TaxID=1872427 RepID=UPI0032D91928